MCKFLLELKPGLLEEGRQQTEGPQSHSNFM